MSVKTHKVQAAWKKNALIDNEGYLKMYKQSVENPEKFWGKHGKRIDWFKPYTKVKNTSFTGNVSIKWYEDGITNVCYNCVDRHLEDARRPDGNHLGRRQSFDDEEHHLYRTVRSGLPTGQCAEEATASSKGDRVTIYMPMIPEAAYAMLACARIGAVHSIVFGGFSPDALAGRIVDCESDIRDHRR